MGGEVWWLVEGCVGWRGVLGGRMCGHSVSSGILLSSILFRIEISSLLILPNFC